MKLYFELLYNLHREKGGGAVDSNYLKQLKKIYSTLNFERHQHDCEKKTPNTHLFIVIKHLYRKVGREVVFYFDMVIHCCMSSLGDLNFLVLQCTQSLHCLIERL